MVYEWGTLSFKVPAQVVGQAVEELIVANGGACPPAKFVEAARSKHSALHPLLPWDDAKAAELHRIHTARCIIKSLKIVMQDSEERPPAFLHVRVLNDTGVNEGYAGFEQVVRDVNLRDQALSEALKYLNGFKNRYRHINELRPVFAAIEEVESVLV